MTFVAGLGRCGSSPHFGLRMVRAMTCGRRAAFQMSMQDVKLSHAIPNFRVLEDLGRGSVVCFLIGQGTAPDWRPASRFASLFLLASC